MSTERRGQVVFVGPDLLPAVGSGLPAICADGCGLTPGPDAGWEAFEMAQPHSTAGLLALPPVQGRLRSGTGAIAVWKSSATVERLTAQLGLGLANTPALIARRIENKAFFSRNALAAGLPIPPTRVGVAGPELLRELSRIPGPYVFQLAHGFSGQNTHPAWSDLELEAVMERFAGRLCRVSQLVSGTPVTVTGVVSQDRLVIGSACVQLTGLPALTPHPMGSCGNDYGRPAPQAESVGELARVAAQWLRRQGHRGVFGLDLVVGADGSITCIEINPRLVASVPLFSLSARDRDQPGILSLHLGAFGLGPDHEVELECNWSQIILYQGGARRGRSDLGSGRGHFAAAGPFRPEAPLGLGGPLAGEVGLLVQGQSRPGGELARLLFQGPCCDADGSLLPQLEACALDLRSRLEAPAPAGSVS